MANLIPPQAKKGVQIEYWVHVASIWFVLFGVAALSVAALHAPVYILIQNQMAAYSSLYEDANLQNTSFEAIGAEIKAANDIAAMLGTARTATSFVVYVSAIESLTNDDVVIESFQLARTDGVLKEIKVSGRAADRSSLVSLSDAIEADERFTSAEIPLSNLAKDSDIPFIINVVLAVEKS